ncbi:hypothetical protein ACMA5I_14995 [Paracoccaceae bacterium GXU_MW_L88]
MTLPQSKPERSGDLIGSTMFSRHKAGSRDELIDAALDSLDRTPRSARPPRYPRVSPSVILAILGIICLIASFAAYDQMLNVQQQIGLLDPAIGYEEPVSAGSTIARTSAYWFYAAAALFGFGLLFIGAMVLSLLLRPKT